MKYLLVALINTIYGILLLTTLKPDTPGFILILFVALILTIMGLVGLAMWLWQVISTQKEAGSAIKSWFQIIKGIDILLVLGLLFRSFILQPFVVEGNSMETNFHNQEFLLVDRISYKFRSPQRGEVIVFRYPKNPNEDYIKRIVGLPGETVNIENGKIYINDNLLNEGYLPLGSQTFTSTENGSLKTTLGPKEYFVLGDNRQNSSDSREWGILPQKNIIGRAWLIVFPFQDLGKVKNPPRPNFARIPGEVF